MPRTSWSSIGRQPPVIRRWTIGYIACGLACVIAAIAFASLREPLGLPRRGWPRYVPLALGLLPSVVILPITSWRTRWIRRAFHESCGRLCVACAYNLAACPDGGRCPECGRICNIARDAETWARAGLVAKNEDPAGAGRS